MKLQCLCNAHARILITHGVHYLHTGRDCDRRIHHAALHLVDLSICRCRQLFITGNHAPTREPTKPVKIIIDLPTATLTEIPTIAASNTPAAAQAKSPTRAAATVAATKATVLPTKIVIKAPAATAAILLPTSTRLPWPTSTQTVEAAIAPPPATGGYTCADGAACIKGNINAGKQLYHFPGCPNYHATKIDTGKGERWFTTSTEAEAAGWVRAGNCPR